MKRGILPAAIVVILLATAVRLHHLGGDSFWFDELSSVLIAREGVAVAAQGQIHHPPLHFVLISLGITALGTSEFAVRFAAAVAAILAVPLLIRLGIVVQRPSAGLWSSLLLALLPFHIRYAQEARDYAFLMTFSLAASVALYLALRRPSLGRWLFFALATTLNLYTHYGALLVLTTHLLLIVGWAGWQIHSGRKRGHNWSSSLRLLVYPGAALALATLLYFPWLPRIAEDIFSQIGADATGLGVTGTTPITIWLREAFYAFGFNSGVMPYVTAVCSVGGLLIITRRRDWLTLAFLLLGGLLPLALINLFQVSRWAFPKYIIYTLPFYLLAAGIGLDGLQHKLGQWGRRGRETAAAATTLILLLIFLNSWPRIRQEHAYAENDWKGVAAHFAQIAQDGDVFISMTLDLADAFNDGIVFPYYLAQTFNDYTVLVNPTQAELAPLLHMEANVWGIALNRVRPIDPGANLDVIPFPGGLYALSLRDRAPSSFDQAREIYRRATAAAQTPGPRCYFLVDLANFAILAGEFNNANGLLAEALAACPWLRETRPEVIYTLPLAVEHGLLAQAEPNSPAARDLARQILRRDNKDATAWQTLTAVNLLHSLQTGQAVVNDDAAPEPVAVRRFVMPQDGDWGDVLFIHPPASVSYRLTLPAEPVTFVSRLALAPESWAWGGDGVTFVALVTTTAETAVTELHRIHINNDENGRRWHPLTIPLTPYTGQTITLTLTTEIGPQGDASGDWAGWEEPRLIWQTISP